MLTLRFESIKDSAAKQLIRKLLKTMSSIRKKITILIALAVGISISAITVIGAITTANLGHSKTEQALSLQCDSGKHALNSYFKSVEQSINTVSDIFNDGLNAIDQNDFAAGLHDHLQDAKSLFTRAAENTSGVLTFYYRLDPSITEATGEKGFWLIDLDGSGFKEHEVTDLSDKQYEAPWFYTPQKRGEALWLPPYFTDNLDVYVISYNVPVYRNGSFFGVVGIEIDYRTMGEQIKDIKILNTGFAFIVDSEDGSIIYHPSLDIINIPESERPAIPQALVEAFKTGEHHLEYTFNGVLKHSAWLELSNGMNIVVAVPDAEVIQTWSFTLVEVILVGIGLMGIFIVATILFSRRITRPLKELTSAAKEINKGNYNVSLDYKGNDEIGVLTKTFNGLIKDLGEYINDLNNIAFEDALTSVGNKSAFDIRVANLQQKIDEGKEKVEFAIVMLDTDELKSLNDQYGHDKGDIYLRNSCALMRLVFEHSIVYRVGGDEFAIILEGEDYENRDALRNRFIERSTDICAFAKEPWEKVRVSIGVAVYDPQIDKGVEEVIIHADHLMYINKRQRKKK